LARPSSDQRRSEILEAVVRVIIDVGFTEMTVGDVARKAGVSTALVHYHFSSKAALISAALRVASDEDKQLRESIAAQRDTATSRIDRVLCGSLPEDAHDASWLLWIETWGETRRSGEIRAVMADLNHHETTILVRLIEEGGLAGEFSCTDPHDAAARLTALRDGLAIQYTLFQPEQPVQVAIDQLRGAIRNNLGLAAARYSALVRPGAAPPTGHAATTPQR
jgi:AcrR family transcriptional regulator